MTTKLNPLLACPFCGSKASAYYDSSADYEGNLKCWLVQCDDPNCAASNGRYETIEEAVLFWNTRAGISRS